MWKKLLLTLSLIFSFGAANSSMPIVEKYEAQLETTFPLNSTAGDAYLYVSSHSMFGKELFAFLVKETNRFSTDWVDKAEELMQLSYEVELSSLTGKEFIKRLSKQVSSSKNYEMYIHSILLKQFNNYSANA